MLVLVVVQCVGRVEPWLVAACVGQGCLLRGHPAAGRDGDAGGMGERFGVAEHVVKGQIALARRCAHGEAEGCARVRGRRAVAVKSGCAAVCTAAEDAGEERGRKWGKGIRKNQNTKGKGTVCFCVTSLFLSLSRTTHSLSAATLSLLGLSLNAELVRCVLRSERSECGEGEEEGGEKGKATANAINMSQGIHSESVSRQNKKKKKRRERRCHCTWVCCIECSVAHAVLAAPRVVE